MSKVLIIGSNGQLANDLIKTFQKSFDLYLLNHRELDIQDVKTTQYLINKIKPKVVINTAAFHNTLECEKNPDISFNINAIGAYNVALATKKIDAQIVYFSSDYIFDGTKKGYFENASPNPLNIYGASKLAGETLIRIANSNHLIIRTSWLYGEKISGKGHNFVSLMLDKANSQKVIEVVNNQYGSPTYTLDLASKVKEAIQKKIKPGTYHLVNSGNCSWYDFAEEIFRLKKIQMNLIPIKSKKDDYLKRPKYSILKSHNLQKEGLTLMRPWKEALNEYIN